MYLNLIKVSSPKIVQASDHTKPATWSVIFKNYPSREEVLKIMYQEADRGNLTPGVASILDDCINEGNYAVQQVRDGNAEA
jgi:hypothetical protein